MTDKVNARADTVNSMTAVFHDCAFQFIDVGVLFDCRRFMTASFDSMAGEFDCSIRWQIVIRN